MIMVLINIETNFQYIGIIEKTSFYDFKLLKKTSNFTFDWNKEVENQVYKIRLKRNEKILGLISLIDIPKECRIHINLIEVAKNHRGKNKTIKNIAACLISYACKIAFIKGYQGFVSLVPKTRLINYYQNYGFVQVGTQMAIFGKASKTLTSKYLANEEI